MTSVFTEPNQKYKCRHPMYHFLFLLLSLRRTSQPSSSRSIHSTLVNNKSQGFWVMSVTEVNHPCVALRKRTTEVLELVPGLSSTVKEGGGEQQVLGKCVFLASAIYSCWKEQWPREGKMLVSKACCRQQVHNV